MWRKVFRLDETLTDRARLQRDILLSLLAAIFAGVVLVVAYSVKDFASDRTFKAFASSLENGGFALLVAGAAMLSGALLGFLFGIPRTLQNEGPYQVNTNLEQISDWLTKIIVGVGLVELSELPGNLMSLNGYVGDGFSPRPWPQGIVGAIIVYFAVGGFLLCYVSTRIHISRAFRDADDYMRRIEKVVDVAVQKVSESTDPAQTPAEKKDAPAKEVRRAAAEIKEAKLRPADVDPQFAANIALTHYGAGDYARAVPFFERAGAASSADPDLAMKYATSLAESGRRDEALKVFRRLADSKLGTPGVFKLIGYYELWDRSLLKESIEWTQRYLAVRPDDSGATFNLACAAAQLYGVTNDDSWRERAKAWITEAVARDDWWAARVYSLREDDFKDMKKEDLDDAIARGRSLRSGRSDGSS